jgi:hypothetical protein
MNRVWLADYDCAGDGQDMLEYKKGEAIMVQEGEDMNGEWWWGALKRNQKMVCLPCLRSKPFHLVLALVLSLYLLMLSIYLFFKYQSRT